jgi:cyanophycinase
MELIASLAGGARGKILVFPQASESPDAGASIEAELKSLGIGRVVLMDVDHAAADGEEALRLTEGATAAYFGGGDQSKLMAVLRGTRLEARLRELYEREGAVMSGTSAGAAVMSRVMITGEETRPLSKEESFQTIEAENVVTTTGLGFLDDEVVDQHFVRRRRHNRLISLVLQRPELLGLAIDEATAVWVKPDRSFEVVGEGPVVVVDAAHAKTARDVAGFGLRGADLRLHVLRAGSQYDLDHRTVVRLGPAATESRPARTAK